MSGSSVATVSESPGEGGSTVDSGWSAAELDLINDVLEVQIAARRANGTLGRRVRIWAVAVNREVYVRTWYRRDSGWFGQVLESARAQIRLPGADVDVLVEDVGEGTACVRGDIDSSYRAKYARRGGVEDMVTAASAATTLRLIPDREVRKQLAHKR